jgi:aryl-alcohol dehydrogenase-like predicted oxidoreductase
VEGEAYVKRYGALVMDDASYAWYLQNQMPVFAFSALAQGFFARAVVDGIDSLPAEKRAYFETPGNLKRLEHVKNYMVEHQVPSSVPVLGYLINNKLPGVALISARTPDMILEALAAADCEMSSQEADGLFEI